MAESNAALDYTPHPVQRRLHSSPANMILYGGAVGAAKSHALRMEAIIWAYRIPRLQVFLFRRTLPELRRTHIIPFLEAVDDSWGHWEASTKTWYCNNGSTINFCYAHREDDVARYRSEEIHVLLIDESTTFTERMINLLMTRNRCVLKIPDKYRHKIPLAIFATNPGEASHEWHKNTFVKFAEPFEVKRAARKHGGRLRQFIPGRIYDNPTIMENDPGYVDLLENLPETLKKQLLHGDWDVFGGQALPFVYDKHVLPHPLPIPENAPLYMTFDHGWSAPFSVGWWWVDQDGRLYRFHEHYGSTGRPNEGVKWSDAEIIRMIMETERDLGIFNRPITRYGDRWCFSRPMNKQNMDGYAPSIAEEFQRSGMTLFPADSSRLEKSRLFRSRLKIPEDDRTWPMMMIYPNCEQFIRTIPNLQCAGDHGKLLEMVDDKGEDHVFDEAALLVVSRPLGDDDAFSPRMTEHEYREQEKRRFEEKIAGTSYPSGPALQEILGGFDL